jgi:hypothetical protein
MAELHAGEEFAGHRIEDVAGRGGMGVVYVATHIALDRRVALKLIATDLAEDPGFRERFQRESRVAASLDHRNVIPIHHAGEEDGALYITMRYVEGTDLRQLITEHGGLPPDAAAEIIAQTAEALDAAHAAGLVHRDVKPANILIDGGVSNPHAFLTDFGLTRRTASAGGLTKTGQWVGTLDYVAPEQIEGKDVDARADVYALGCVLFQALTGEVPYPKDSDVAKMWAHMNDEPPSVRERSPNLPAQFEEIVSKSMAKDPDDRYPSAGNLGEAAKAAAGGREAAAPERSVAVGSAAPGGAPASAETAAAARRPAAETAASPAPPPATGTPPPPPPPAGPGAPAPPRAPAPPAKPPPAPRPAAPKGPRKRPSPVLIAGGAAGALILVAVILLVTGVLGGGGDEDPDTSAAGALLADFEVAFASEDKAALDSDVLANSADYVFLGDTPISASTEYSTKFGAMKVADYQLDVGEITPTSSGFEAEASYSFVDEKDTDSEGTPFPLSGTLTFEMADDEAGELRIDQITVVPDLVTGWTVTDPPESTDTTVKSSTGDVISELSMTFEEKGQDFLVLPIDPEAAPSLGVDDRFDATTEWAGPKEASTEKFKLSVPQSS